jgi:UDP-galactopyranose mutase
MDFRLLVGLAEARPNWHMVMVGPVTKIEEEKLPRLANIHYLGQKDYDDLPTYLSGWDVAILPFAMNEHTLKTSPTKIPEYLAGGKPVISTPVRDVVRTYMQDGLVWVAENLGKFILAAPGRSFSIPKLMG